MKVMDLLKKVARYSGVITTYVVPFTELQEAIRDYCPEEYFTIIMRRLMMKLSQKVAFCESFFLLFCFIYIQKNNAIEEFLIL